MIVNWPGKTPAGKVNADMIDSTDFVPTFAELTGSKLSTTNKIDGQSFLPQAFGQKGKPRKSIFIQLGPNWYVREQRWKLNQDGHLYDMSGAPWSEPRVPDDTKDPAAIEVRKRLQSKLEELAPEKGILDTGDGSGRHASRAKKDHSKKIEQQKTEIK